MTREEETDQARLAYSRAYARWQILEREERLAKWWSVGIAVVMLMLVAVAWVVGQ